MLERAGDNKMEDDAEQKHTHEKKGFISVQTTEQIMANKNIRANAQKAFVHNLHLALTSIPVAVVHL